MNETILFKDVKKMHALICQTMSNTTVFLILDIFKMTCAIVFALITLRLSPPTRLFAMILEMTAKKDSTRAVYFITSYPPFFLFPRLDQDF